MPNPSQYSCALLDTGHSVAAAAAARENLPVVEATATARESLVAVVVVVAVEIIVLVARPSLNQRRAVVDEDSAAYKAGLY
ncbi:MAG: hypothetical protein HC782_00265 [Gammaproteobacteria bacterium]|nr:hypothetical protein [Gammaproteobacteria bacterium]